MNARFFSSSCTRSQRLIAEYYIKKLLILTVGLLLLCAPSSCKEDDDLTLEELIAQDPLAPWRVCGPGSYFLRDEPNGPCLKCNTEQGYIVGGRDGQLCYVQEFAQGYHRMVLFDSLPVDWWPSDTLYFGNSSRNEAEAMQNGFGSGSFTTIGISLDENMWIAPWCTEAEWGNVLEKAGWGYGSFMTSSGRYGFFNGESFSFNLSGSEINGDCFAEVGYVRGYTERDTSFATVDWVTIRGPQENRGDTVLTSTFIMVEPPAWVQTWKR